MKKNYIPEPQKVLKGFGHPLTTFAGRRPGILTLCNPVDKRLACTATKFPPTPEK